jgi:uncharacterized protein YbjT (DUF2867 family)
LHPEKYNGRILEITGPESLSFTDLAAILGKEIDKQIVYVAVPAKAALDGMIQSGMPEFLASGLVDLFTYFAEGRAAALTNTVKDVTGKEPISFERFAREHAKLFL